jgi:hypothetical protein
MKGFAQTMLDNGLPSYGYIYPSRPKEIKEQTDILQQHFPNIGFADEKLDNQPVPVGAEGWFAIPEWQSIAPTYGQAVDKILLTLCETRDGKFHNYCKGKTGPKYLRQHENAAKLFQQQYDKQKKYNIPVFPCQFGIRYRNQSVHRARRLINSISGGLELGAFATGIMLLTHPERLQHQENLWIYCSGDEFAPDANDKFTHAPFFYFYNGKLMFDVVESNIRDEKFGSVSGFLS